MISFNVSSCALNVIFLGPHCMKSFAVCFGSDNFCPVLHESQTPISSLVGTTLLVQLMQVYTVSRYLTPEICDRLEMLIVVIVLSSIRFSMSLISSADVTDGNDNWRFPRYLRTSSRFSWYDLPCFRVSTSVPHKTTVALAVSSATMTSCFVLLLPTV